MAKRFIDTGLFDDEWFSNLSQGAKLFWIYYMTKCDHAGLMKLNVKLIKFQTGIKEVETVIKELGNRMVTVNEQLLFCPKFLTYQYPGFPEGKKFRAVTSAIDLLNKHNIDFNSLVTLSKELPNSYGNGNGNGNGNIIMEWRENFDFYKSMVFDTLKELSNDKDFISAQSRFYPTLDIPLSLEKSVVTFWGTEAGWKHKKASKSKDIDIKSTLVNALSFNQNKVYKQNGMPAKQTLANDQTLSESWES